MSGFSTVKLLFFSLCMLCPFRGTARGGLCFISYRAGYRHKLFGILYQIFLYSPLFIYSLIFIYLFLTFGSNVYFLYKFSNKFCNPEGKNNREIGQKVMFEVIMAGNFPNLINDINPLIHQTKLIHRHKRHITTTNTHTKGKMMIK